VDPWGLWSWPWQWSWDFTIHDFSGRPFLEFRSEDVVPGIETGLAGVGSAFSFGIWDGGRWRDQPGFAVSRGLGYVGVGALGVAAGGLLAPRLAQIPITVATWAPAGVVPTVTAGRWVVVGGQNWFGWLRSLTWLQGYPLANGAWTTLTLGQLALPPAGVFSGVPILSTAETLLAALLGQFVVKSCP